MLKELGADDEIAGILRMVTATGLHGIQVDASAGQSLAIHAGLPVSMDGEFSASEPDWPSHSRSEGLPDDNVAFDSNPSFDGPDAVSEPATHIQWGCPEWRGAAPGCAPGLLRPSKPRGTLRVCAAGFPFQASFRSRLLAASHPHTLSSSPVGASSSIVLPGLRTRAPRSYPGRVAGLPRPSQADRGCPWKTDPLSKH